MLSKQSKDYYKFLKEGKNVISLNVKDGIKVPAIFGIAWTNKSDYKQIAK